MDVQALAPSISSVGTLIRHRRRELGLTQGAVADAAGLSVGFISQIERGLTMPSLTSVVGIAEALDCTPGDFLRQPRTPPRVTYRESREALTVSEDVANRYTYERLSTVFAGSTLHSVLFHIPPGYEVEAVAHRGEELVYVLDGSMLIEIDDDRFVLNAGDSVHFNSGDKHRYSSNSDGMTTVIYVGTLGIFG